MRPVSLFFLSLLICFSALAQPSASDVPTADQIMKSAFVRAAKEKKNVLLMFHASWCGWCHRMDTSLNDTAVKKYFDDNYVITHLVVDESGANKVYENAGAYELRTKYHGNGVGIPFWLIFDKNGKLLADSKIRKNGENEAGGNNIGCPANPEEVDFFIEILKKTSSLKEGELATIAARFRQNAH